MSNPIKYSELIQDDNQGFKGLLSALEKADRSLQSIMNTARTNAETLKKALAEANPATLAGQNEIAALSKEIDTLNKRIKELEANQKQYKQTQREAIELDRLATESKLRRKEMTQQLNQAVKAGAMTQAQENEIMQKAADETKVHTLSVNELRFALNKLTASYNSLSATTTEAAAARERDAMSIKRVKDQLNTLNQAIGNYTGSVGNYAKSWNGLNIAMQQIARETPNLAMGFNTFMLAISNNIPILADQIEIAQKQYQNDMNEIAALEKLGNQEARIAEIRARAIPVGKQMLNVLKSWQLWLVAGVTVMTLFGDKLIKMLGDWIKSKKGIEDATEAIRRYNQALTDASKPAAEATAKLNTLYRVATDLNASMEDRLGAVQDLKNVYPDVFEGLETEAILAGNAREQYELLSQSIYKTAMAEAAYRQLSDVASAEVAAKIQMQDLNRRAFEMGFLGASDMAQYYGQTRMIDVGGVEQEVFTLTEDQRKLVREYDEVIESLEDSAKRRKTIEDMMKNNDLFGFLGNDSNSGRGANGKPETVDDVYWAMVEASINSMDDSLEKELQLLQMNFEKTKAELIRQRDEFLKLSQSNDKIIADEAVKQLGYVYGRIEAETDTYNKERGRLLGYYDKNGDAIDPDIAAREAIETRLKVEKAIWDGEAYSLYEMGQKTQDELNALLAENNTRYWTKYIQDMRDKGLLTPEGYNTAMSNLVKAQNSSSNKSGSKSQRYKKRTWTSKLLGKAVGVVLDPNSPDYDQAQVNEFEIYEQGLRKIMGKTVDYINDVIDAYIELKQAAVDAAQAQVDAAQKVYEAELGAYENGYANNVEYARKELALRKEQLAQAQEEQRKAQQMQMAISAASQAASLAEAVANTFASATKVGNPLVAIPLALAATSALIAAFSSSKAMASKAATVQYGEGMHEYLDYGGSHASGNDIDFGVSKDGKRRRVERGEMIAVFNKRNTDKYGAANLANLVDSINHGTFESAYASIFSNGVGSGNGVIVMNNIPDSVSDDISAIRKSTESQRYSAGNGTIIEKHRNRTRIIHLS